MHICEQINGLTCTAETSDLSLTVICLMWGIFLGGKCVSGEMYRERCEGCESKRDVSDIGIRLGGKCVSDIGICLGGKCVSNIGTCLGGKCVSREM